MPDICHALPIGASPESVFDAVNSEKGERSFWTDQAEYDPEVGSIATFSFGPNAETRFEFRIDVLDRPTRIEWTCVGGPPEWQPTSIVWTFRSEDGSTKVRFEHRNWASADGELAACTFTWGRILSELDRYVTTGSATPPFKIY